MGTPGYTMCDLSFLGAGGAAAVVAVVEDLLLSNPLHIACELISAEYSLWAYKTCFVFCILLYGRS